MKTKLWLSLALFAALGTSQTRADITTGLVLYLPLNETTGVTAFDQSGNGYDATYTNNAAGTPITDDSQWTNGGWSGGACKINYPLNPGTTNFLMIPTTATGLYFDTVRHFTLAAWVKIPAQAAGVIMASGYGNGGEQYDLDISASKYRLVIRSSQGGGATNVTSAANVSFNNWQHIVATWDGPNKIEALYVNGQLSAQNLNGTPVCAISTNVVTIGARSSGKDPNSYNLTTTNMLIDEVRMYNRTLTAADVYELYSYNGHLPQITTQPRSVTNHVGDSVIFSTAIDANNSTLPVGYQWLSNSVAIPNATNTTLTLTNVQLSYSAGYSVQITNIIGATNTATAFLQVNSMPAADSATGLVGNWKFDDAAGSSTAADSSANANAGALVNFTDTTSVWGTGVNGGDLNFNGDATGVNLVAIPGVGTPAPSVLDFSSSPAFTLSAFIKAAAPSNGPAIICKGTGGGGEQYCVDMQTTGYRFFVRNAAAASTAVTGPMPANNTWQHITAVFDAINGIQSIYTNGQLAAVAIAPFDLLPNSHEVSIGNRQSSAVSAYNFPFTGALDDVRIYNRALTSADIQQLYASSLADPYIFVQPTNATVVEGGNAIFSVTAHGNTPLSYLWYQNNSPLNGQTNAMLVLSNVQGSANNNSYYVHISDTASFVDSATVILTVNSSAPVFSPDLPAQLYAFAGSSFSASVAATGSLPITYRWQYNGTDMQDSAHISGSHSNVLTLDRAVASDAGSYQVIASNQRGDTTSTAAVLSLQQIAKFYDTGANWSLRSGATIANNVLTLTDGGTSEVRAAWFASKQYIGAFSNSWIYQDVNTAGADGTTFTIQNDARGTAAIGGNGSNLGINTITPSFSFCLNIFTSNTRGYCWATNGVRGAPPYTTTAPVNLASGDPILVTLVYANGVITATLTDQTTSDTFTTSRNVNIPALVGGNSATIGFTGTDGGTTSTQQISNFIQVSLASLTAQLNGNNVILTWPQNVGGYQLQQTATLGTPWQPVANPVSLINGFNQVTVPATSSGFYQLNVPLQ